MLVSIIISEKKKVLVLSIWILKHFFSHKIDVALKFRCKYRGFYNASKWGNQMTLM